MKIYWDYNAILITANSKNHKRNGKNGFKNSNPKIRI